MDLSARPEEGPDTRITATPDRPAPDARAKTVSARRMVAVWARGAAA